MGHKCGILIGTPLLFWGGGLFLVIQSPERHIPSIPSCGGRQNFSCPSLCQGCVPLRFLTLCFPNHSLMRSNVSFLIFMQILKPRTLGQKAPKLAFLPYIHHFVFTEATDLANYSYIFSSLFFLLLKLHFPLFLVNSAKYL